MENELVRFREEINLCDKILAEAFEKRMLISKEIAEYKFKNSLPVFDEKREKEVIMKNKKHINDEAVKEYYVEFLKKSMELSKKFQNSIIKKLEETK